MKINLLVFMQDRTPVRFYCRTQIGVISVLTSSGKGDRINSDKQKNCSKIAKLR